MGCEQFKKDKICRHKLSDLYHGESSSNHWLNTQLFDYAELKMFTVYTVVMPFRVPVGNVTAKHCAAINPSHVTSLYELLQRHFHFPLLRTNCVDMAKSAG
jgi:hypothetical protein